MSMVQAQALGGNAAAELLGSYSSRSPNATVCNLLERVRFTDFQRCGASLSLPKGSTRLSIIQEAMEAFAGSCSSPLIKPETFSQIENDARFTRRLSRETPIKLVGSLPGAQFRSEAQQRGLLSSEGLSAPRIEDLLVAAVLFELATKESFLRGVLAVRANDGILFRGAEGLELGSKTLQEQLAGFIGAIGAAAQLRVA